jgi:hypothetical protein
LQAKPPLPTSTATAANSSATAQVKPSPTAVVALDLVKPGGETTHTSKPATNESVSVAQTSNARRACSAVHQAGADIAMMRASGDVMPKADDDTTIFQGSENVMPSVEATALSIQEELNLLSAAALAESHTGEASVEMKAEDEPVASACVADSSMVMSKGPVQTETEAKRANEDAAEQDEKPRRSLPTRSAESSSGMTSSCSGEFKNSTDIVRISC